LHLIPFEPLKINNNNSIEQQQQQQQQQQRNQHENNTKNATHEINKKIAWSFEYNHDHNTRLKKEDSKMCTKKKRKIKTTHKFSNRSDDNTKCNNCNI